MTEFWTDAHLSPGIARWIQESHPDCSARPIRDLGLREATDVRIFDAAAAAGAVLLTKDRDFALLRSQRVPAPRLVLLTCGNTSNARLRSILQAVMPRLLERLEEVATYVEVFDETSLGT